MSRISIESFSIMFSRSKNTSTFFDKYLTFWNLYGIVWFNCAERFAPDLSKLRIKREHGKVVV